jgi:hypothetical protein
MFSKKRIGIFVFLSTFLVGVLSSYFYYNELPIGDATYYFNAASLIKENITYLLISPRIGVVESFNAIIQGLLFFFTR